MRIIFLSDNMMRNSAYAKIVYNLSQLLIQAGHKVALIPMGRSDMTQFEYKGVIFYPTGNNEFGEDVALKHYTDFRADMLITVKEPWVFSDINRIAFNYTPMAIIDHSPVSAWITSKLINAFRVIAVSEHGQSELKKAGIKSDVVHHGVDTEVFRPLHERRPEIRKIFAMEEDAYVIDMIMMNRARKMISRQLRGVKRFIDQNPDIKTRVWLWSDVNPSSGYGAGAFGGIGDIGVSLLPEIIALGLNDVIRWPEQRVIAKGVPDCIPTYGPDDWDMVKMYNMADANLLASGGEGAGLTYLEAAACGLPSIGTDYASAKEYIGPGYAIPYSDYVILNSPGTRMALADIDKIAESLQKIANGNREKAERRLLAHARNFSWERIFDREMIPFLNNCEADLRPLFTKEGQGIWRRE